MRLVLLLALLSVAGAAAAAEEKDSFSLVASFSGGSFFWTLENATEKNPTLVVPPNATVRVRIVNEGAQVHNFVVAGQPPSAYVSEEVPVVEHSFQAPASGYVEYYCQPHRAANMWGYVLVAGSEAPARDETPALGLVATALALGAAALVARRRA